MKTATDVKPSVVDKAQMRRIVEARNAEMGIVYNPDVTAEEVREMMLKCGVRPEENLGSRGIIAARGRR